MVIDRLFAAILTGLLTFAVSFLKDVADSVNKLNIQMGVVISRMENYDSRIEKLEDYNARIKR
jgi:flagellin-like hook-associated protein FlgL